MVELIEQLLAFCCTGGVISSEELIITEPMLDIANKVFTFFCDFGIVLTIVYFLIDINKVTWMEGRNNVDIKTFVKPFFMLAASIVVLCNGGTIMSMVVNIYNALIEEGSSIAGTVNVEDFSESFINAVDPFFGSWGFLILIMLVIPSILLYICSLAVSLIFSYKALIMKLKLLTRICFAPMAFADVYNLQQSTAIRYVKGSVAIGVTAMAMLFIPAIGGQMFQSDFILAEIANASTVGILEGTLLVIKAACGCLLVPIAEIGMINVAEQFAKEALGS